MQERNIFLRDRVVDLLNRIKYASDRDGHFRVMRKGEAVFLQHVQFLPDSTQPGSPGTLQAGRKWYISPFMTDGEIIQTALMAVLAFEEHEAREGFLFDGKRIFSPHKSVRALMATEEERRQEVA